MARNLKVFNTQSEYNAYIGGEPIFPNVSYCVDQHKVHFNKRAPEPTIPFDEIWYTTASEEPINLEMYDTVFGQFGGVYSGPEILSNTYENGKGVIKFASDIEKIGVWIDGQQPVYCCCFVCEESFGLSHDLVSIVLPDSIQEIKTATLPVPGVGELEIPTFGNCELLESVVLPSGLTNIEYYTFSYCYKLSSITIPNSVTEIGEGAFIECSGLTSIDLHSVVTIGGWAFCSCENLQSVYISSTVRNIGEDAFYNRWSISEFVVDSNNPKYDSRNNCNALIETETNTLIIGFGCSTIPNTVVKIGDRAFQQSFGLRSINIPNSVTELGESAFISCLNVSAITIPSSVTSIGRDCFGNCPVIAENFVNNSEAEGFPWGCELAAYETSDGLVVKEYNNKESLITCRTYATTVNIPNTIYRINYYAFNFCNEITSLDIPANVEEIGWYAFYCENLLTMTFHNISPTHYSATAIDNTTAAKLEAVYVPAESVNTYKAIFTNVADKIQPIAA